MTVYSLAPIAYTFTLYRMQPTSGGTSWIVLSSPIIKCTTAASVGGSVESCTPTSNVTVPAGDMITIVASMSGTPTPSEAFLAFSCF